MNKYKLFFILFIIFLLLITSFYIYKYFFNKKSSKEAILFEIKCMNGPNIYRHNKVIVIEFKNNFDLNKIKNDIVNIHNKIKYNIDYIVIKNNKIIFEFIDDDTSEKLCKAVINKTYLSDEEISDFQDSFDCKKTGQSTLFIINEMNKKLVPYFFYKKSLSQLIIGQGYKQKKFEPGVTCNTSRLAMNIASDKSLTKDIFTAINIPTSRGFKIDNTEDLYKYYDILKKPVVIKPVNLNHSIGVTLNINNKSDLLKAYKEGKKFHELLIIEEFLEGTEHRITVVDGKIVGFAKSFEPFVIGDGINTILDLIKIANNKDKLTITEFGKKNLLEDLSIYGYDLNSIPKKDEKVKLITSEKLSTCIFGEELNDIHHSIKEHAINAAQQIGLNIAGIDMVCKDTNKPLEVQKGGFVEINAGPSFQPSMLPYFGKPKNIAKCIINQLFDENDNGRIPIIAITGTNGKTTTTNLTAFILRQKYVVGKTNTNGVYINNRQIESGDCSGPRSSQKVLMSPEVEACVLECARGGILKGLGFDYCDVGVIINIGKGDHIGKNYNNATIDDIIHIKSTLYKNILPNGYAVLNANEPALPKILKYVNNKIIYFSVVKNNIIKESIKKNIPVVYYEDNIYYEHNGKKIKFNIDEIPLCKDKIIFQIENVLASISTCIGIGLDISLIRTGINNFKNDITNNPGRMNEINYKKSKILIDYAHNEDSIDLICDYVSKTKYTKKIVLFGAAGDREEDIIVKMSNKLYNTFDTCIFFVDKGLLRGKTKEELFRLMINNLKLGDKKIYKENDELSGVKKGISLLEDNYLFVILIDNLNKIIDYLKNIDKN